MIASFFTGVISRKVYRRKMNAQLNPHYGVVSIPLRQAQEDPQDTASDANVAFSNFIKPDSYDFHMNFPYFWTILHLELVGRFLRLIAQRYKSDFVE